MKKRRYIAVLGMALCLTAGLFAADIPQIGNIDRVQAAEYWPEAPEIESPNAIVMEVSTGVVLYEKNAHEQHYPASITKIMTAMLALENSSLDETITFSNDAVYKTEGSSIYRDVGEQMTMEQTLYAIMLESANECAYAIAEHVAGSEDAFVDMMNARAAELGCTDTHFSNPHGLTEEDHYTSCYDMALIAREAYKNEIYRTIISTGTYQIPPTNKHPDEITYLLNHNRMIHPFRDHGEYVYEYCVGGKTGYTDAANSTLVTYAQKDGMTLVCVIMNTKSPAQWEDSIALYDYYLDQFTVYSIAENETRLEEGEKSTSFLGEQDSYAKISEDSIIVLPRTGTFAETVPTVEVKEDSNAKDVIATVEYTFAGHFVGSADILANEAAVEPFPFDNIKPEMDQAAGTAEGSHKLRINIWMVLLCILGVAALGVLIWVLKYFIDHFYIIRHKYFDKPKKDKRFHIIKNTYNSKRMRKHRRKRNGSLKF
ncbi:MAG: D-alanyl-D-alanine carboxypeptidase [Lachnospiraceae bacterium]|nr:D-alanyl-D-alanine carboxypeptidase [Lachnospiraceae bacterium]